MDLARSAAGPDPPQAQARIVRGPRGVHPPGAPEPAREPGCDTPEARVCHLASPRRSTRRLRRYDGAMRTLLPSLLVLLLGLPAAARAEDDVATPSPANLKELGDRLERLVNNIQSLIEEAKKDPAERQIEIYNAYTKEELHFRRRDVRAALLVEFMVDSKKNFNVRLKAKEAIHLGCYQRPDPDLSTSEKQGRRSKRAYFCDRYLIKHLRDEEDPITRKLVSELLREMWPVNNVSEITNYKVNEKKTWTPAYQAWKKFLSRR